MNDQIKRYFFIYYTPVLCAVFIILSFCCYKSMGLVLAALATVSLLIWIKKREALQFHLIDFVVLVLISIEFIAGLFNTHDISGRTYLFGFFFNVQVYFIIRLFLQKQSGQNLFIQILSGFVILLSLLTVASFLFFKFNIEYEGFNNLVDFKNNFHPLGFLLNDWAAILILALTFLLLALVKARFNSILCWILIIGLAMCVFGIVSSFSRGAYISVTIGILVFFVFGLGFRVVKIKKMSLIFLGVITILFFTTIPVKKAVVTTVGFSGTTSQVRSTSGRIELWETALKLIQKEPITGIGHGNFPLYANPYLSAKEDAMFTGRTTNSYLQLLAEKGIIGFIPWAVLLFLLLFVLLRLIKAKEKYSLSALLVFSVFIAVLFRELTFSTFFEKPQMQLLFFILAAWIVNLKKKIKSRLSLPRLVLPLFLATLFIALGSFNMRYKIASKRNNAFIEKYQNADYNGALLEINKALKLDPKNALLNANKGFLLSKFAEQDSSKNYKKKSLACYKKAVGYSPLDPWIHNNLAWLHSEEGKPDRASYHLNKACELSPNKSLFILSKSLFKEKQDINIGLTDFMKAIRLSPDLLDSEFTRDVKSENPEDFKTQLNELAKNIALKIQTDNSPIIKSRLAKIRLHLGDTTIAMQLLEEVSTQLPNLDRPWFYMGMIKHEQKDTTTFLQYLNRAILLDSRDYLYSHALGNFYDQQNKKRDAIYYYKNALFNHANIYSNHSLIAPRWYGYKTLLNNNLPQDMLEYTKPYMDKTDVCDRLVELYSSLGQTRESRLFEKYNNKEIGIYTLFKELNRSNGL